MTIADAYRRLGAVLSGLETQGIEVSAVTPHETEGEDPLVVDLRITVPSDADAPEVHFGQASAPGEVGAAGGARTAPNAEAAPTPAEPAPGSKSESASESEPASESTDRAGDAAEGEFPCPESGCPAAFDSEPALTVHRLAEHDRPEGPLHQYEPALRAAYEAYDSFASMTEALGVDVTAQTVRRNMMKAGIHTPDTDDDRTGDVSRESESAADSGPTDERPGADGREDADGVPDSGGSAADEQPIADGSGTAASAQAEPPARSAAGSEPSETGTAPDPAAELLPGDVTVEALREAVVDGGSLRAVARALDRSSEETRALLEELGLLEQVHGRVATRPDREQRAAAFDDWLETHRSDSTPCGPSRTDG